jgi:hypothetical protein
MTRRQHRHNVAAAVAMLATLGLVAVWLGLLLWPYDSVRSSPVPSKITPSVIEAGDTVTLTREWYCNDGVDVVVVRWADRYDASGHITASLSLPPAQFFAAGPVCYEPSVQLVAIPPYIIAVPTTAGGPAVPTKYRLRFETTYKANPIRHVTVTSFSDPFVILPERGTT